MSTRNESQTYYFIKALINQIVVIRAKMLIIRSVAFMSEN